MHALLRRMALLRWAVRSGYRLMQQLRYEVWIIDGRERDSGAPLTLLFSGQLENKHYLTHSVYVGSSRAFLSDGVLGYKHKWGMRLLEGSGRWFALTIAHNSVAVSAFLARNPFIFDVGGRRYGAAFVDHESSPILTEQVAALNLRGLDGVVIFRSVPNHGWQAASFYNGQSQAVKA